MKVFTGKVLSRANNGGEIELFIEGYESHNILEGYINKEVEVYIKETTEPPFTNKLYLVEIWWENTGKCYKSMVIEATKFERVVEYVDEVVAEIRKRHFVEHKITPIIPDRKLLEG